MEYRTLGHSGCAASNLALGTMTFGAETDEPGAHQQLDRFVEAGGTLVDTANTYGSGRSEEIIGRWCGMEAYDRRGTDRTWNVIGVVQKVAEKRSVSMAEIALAWVTDRPGVTSTILGARTLGQLETNLRAAHLHLTPAETAELDAASDPHATDYPYGELGMQQRYRSLTG
jgi:aryl-alcohol dehydrogenase-like predicted oxidoreductase